MDMLLDSWDDRKLTELACISALLVGLFSSSKRPKWNFSYLSAANCCLIIIIILPSRYTTCHLLQILNVHVTVILANIRAKSLFKRRNWHWMLVHLVALYF
jgi:hypothetical protein